jgi:hypothetical protein
MNDQYVTYSAAWFTLSLINAGLAQSKGRSGSNWWLISLFIGPFATFLIVASPAVEPGTPEGRMTRMQAVIIGVIVIVLVVGILGLLAAGFGSGGVHSVLEPTP